jgi:hypothetical protein
MPASVRLQLRPPPGFEEDDLFVELLRERLAVAEERAAADLEREGRSVLGAARVRAQNPNSRPAPREPRRGLSPRVACRNKWRRIEALLRLDSFHEAYQEALDRWRSGARETLFPAGTWLMRVQHAACCAVPC